VVRHTGKFLRLVSRGGATECRVEVNNPGLILGGVSLRRRKSSIWGDLLVCERHFRDKDFKAVHSNRKLLKRSAFPSIFLNRWTITQVEALIAQYKTYPVLYSNSHKDRENVDLRNQCLSHVVQALQFVRPGVTAVDVVSQWNNLVIKYMQAARRQLEEPTGAEVSGKMWSQPALHFCRCRSPTCGTSKKWTLWASTRVWRT
jgi:hypothetical protein